MVGQKDSHISSHILASLAPSPAICDSLEDIAEKLVMSDKMST